MFKFNGRMSEDDFIEFNVFHMNNSKSLQRSIFLMRFIFPVVFMLFGIISEKELDVIFWTILVIGSIIMFLWLPSFTRKSVKRRIKLALKEKKNGDMFLEKDFIVDNEGIKVESINTSNFYKWGSIVRIEESENMFYIYVSSIQAIVLPKRYVNDKNIDEFREYIDSFVTK